MTGEGVRRIRRDAGLSLEQLADYLNLGPNGAARIREFERGKRDASGPIIRLLELLNAGEVAEYHLPPLD